MFQSTRSKLVAGGAAVVLLGGIGTSVALAAGGDDGPEDTHADVPITGDALQQASDAALAATGGGRVTETEVGDEESYYEVEVTLEDGTQVDVQLDEQFHVVGQESDGATDDGD